MHRRQRIGPLSAPHLIVYSVYMALPRPLCTRLPLELESELEDHFAALDWSPSEGLRSIVREWLAVRRFAALEFRDTAFGRRAAVRGGPEVWEVAQAAGEPRRVGAALESHFSWVARAALEEALAYAEAFPGEIRKILERNRRLAGGGDA